ncbi:uncharacterized protein PG986_004877 [Apiospora aurea]|uniref:Uncharacterized protein n=1 Tax=Apiospora aurea TaxID=335848 RepID=A0ABR1QG06_9PEZI
MTEPLGVVASGIAVAQLGVATGGAVFKLRQLWGQVKDVPETISDLIERIDLIYPAVWDFEQQFSHAALPSVLWDNTTAVRSVAYCRKALQKLSNVVDDLSVKIASRRGFQRKLVAARVVLKKDELKKLEEQLKIALDVLGFAQEAYNRALLTAMPRMIRLNLRQSMQTYGPPMVQPVEAEVSSPNTRELDEQKPVHAKSSSREDDQKLVHSESQYSYRSKRRPVTPWKPLGSFGVLSIHTGPNELGAEVRPPWWLAGITNSFSLYMSTYRWAWDVQIRLYSERSEDEPVFDMAALGNLAGLQSLFDQRKASPFDRDEDGWTLLHYAAANCQVEITSFLLETGMDLTQIDRWGR